MSSEALTSDVRAEAPLEQAPATPFHDLDRYIALPRLASLALSPDGSRLVTCVGVLNPAAGTEYVSALWEVDPAGERPARRITRSSKGESGAAFARNGDLYFTSARPNPDDPAEEPVPALWRLAGGRRRRPDGPPRPGGVAAVRCARDADTVVVDGQVPGRFRRRRGRREPADRAQGQEGLRDPAFGVPGALLGPRPGPGGEAALRPAGSRR